MPTMEESILIVVHHKINCYTISTSKIHILYEHSISLN